MDVRTVPVCALLVCFTAGTAGCGRGGGSPPTWTASIDTVGDTVVVRTLSGSVWGRDRRLTVDVVYGREGGDNALLGGPTDLAVLPDGGIVVADYMGPRLVTYAGDGTFRRVIGRVGDGPGEYRRISGLAAYGDGRILIHDLLAQRLMTFDSLGRQVATARLEARWDYVHSLLPGPGDSVAVRFWRPRPGRTSAASFMVVNGALDVVDSILLPEPRASERRPGVFQPRLVFAWHPDGFPVLGRSGDYAIDLRRTDGTVLRIERPWTPVRVADAEWEVENELREIMARRGPRVPIPEVPRTKPAFMGILTARTGEIWVHRHTAAVKLWERPPDIVAAGGKAASPYWEPLLFDVFDRDGRFLGSVSGPARTDVFAVSSDTVWAGILDADHTPLVVRFVARPK